MNLSRLPHDATNTMLMSSYFCQARVAGGSMSAYRTKRYRYLRAVDGPQSVDPGPVAEHIRLLNKTIGCRRIAELAGVSYDTVRRILTGNVIAVNKSTAAQIYAVIPEPGAKSLVSAIGTQRRLQALLASGWSVTEIARRADMAECQVSRFLRQQRITKAQAARMAELTDDLSRQAPPVNTIAEKRAMTIAKRLAKKRGYLDWIVWDDIDDPNDTPHLPGRGRKEPPRHGTSSGAKRHRRLGEKPCPACQEAESASKRERNAA